MIQLPRYPCCMHGRSVAQTANGAGLESTGLVERIHKYGMQVRAWRFKAR